MAKKNKNPEQLVCAFCGAVKNEISFFIGATTKPDWCMVYGTGKIACPLCYNTAVADAEAKRKKIVIEKLVDL